MLSGHCESYVTVQSKNTYQMPSNESAMMFLQLCQAIDIVKDQEYRYGYDLKKAGRAGSSGKQGWEITVMDIGE